jgi:hypothetical protein
MLSDDKNYIINFSRLIVIHFMKIFVTVIMDISASS